MKIVSAALVLALVACTQPRSDKCRKVCALEAECVTKTGAGVPFDEKECVAACSALENDSDNLAKVQKHYECVMKNQQTCASVLECD